MESITQVQAYQFFPVQPNMQMLQYSLERATIAPVTKTLIYR